MSDIVILGLSVTSSWGNGHATTYRSLIRGLAARGHRILFLERDVPWYADNRDLPQSPEAEVRLYDNLSDLKDGYERQIAEAALVIVGSFVPEGIEVGEWVTSVARGVTGFYDIDTPVTIEKLESSSCEYLSSDLIPHYDLYLSFTGGPMLKRIEKDYGSPMARVLYCSVDPKDYRPMESETRWDLGYLGTYSEDRQGLLERFLLTPAHRMPASKFVVAGPMYPESVLWPANVERTIHLSPKEHPDFYGSQRFTLNVTRAGMIAAGFSPSVRLFEAGACGVPILSDYWNGLETLFRPGHEILIVASEEDVLRYLFDVSDQDRKAIGVRARTRILAEHTPLERAVQLEGYYREAYDRLSADSTRRNGRSGTRHNGLAPGSSTERSGHRAGTPSVGKAGQSASGRNLQQPTGENAANGGSAGSPAGVAGSPLGSGR